MRLIHSLKITGVAVTVALAGCVTSATAQEPPAEAAPADDGYPLVSGDFWEITGVDIKPGGGLYYATIWPTAGAPRRSSPSRRAGSRTTWSSGIIITGLASRISIL